MNSTRKKTGGAESTISAFPDIALTFIRPKFLLFAPTTTATFHPQDATQTPFQEPTQKACPLLGSSPGPWLPTGIQLLEAWPVPNKSQLPKPMHLKKMKMVTIKWYVISTI